MFLIHVDNVHQALSEGCRLMERAGKERTSRNGPCLQLPGPLMTIYEEPKQRVLFYPQRDANPFFHFAESLWMLAGREDVPFLRHYNSNIANYSDDGYVFNAAYGYRWRRHFGFDQLRTIVENLRRDPSCRRQVLLIWDPADLRNLRSKDIACNTTAYFQVGLDDRLDMMVSNRSNDLIWGAYGANAVHFSILQEFVAHFAGRLVGRYTHVSMNTHVYARHYDLVKELALLAPEPPATRRDRDPYWSGLVVPYPLAQTLSMRKWEEDLLGLLRRPPHPIRSTDPFFEEVAAPILTAWDAFKSGQPNRIEIALRYLESCVAPDWRKAGSEWLRRRMK